MSEPLGIEIRNLYKIFGVRLGIMSMPSAAG